MGATNSDFYQTIEKTSTAEFRDRGSKFIAYSYPITSKEEFKARLAEIKKEHPKASHHCFAYRLGFDGNDFRVSDDGEPSGTAGRPILGQIDSKQLTNVLIIVVRYFGGTLLGVPGLIHAYKTSAAQALEAARIIQKPVLVNFELEFDYTRMNEVRRIIKHYDVLVMKQDLQLFCKFLVGIPINRVAQVQSEFSQIAGVVCKQL